MPKAQAPAVIVAARIEFAPEMFAGTIASVATLERDAAAWQDAFLDRGPGRAHRFFWCHIRSRAGAAH